MGAPSFSYRTSVLGGSPAFLAGMDRWVNSFISDVVLRCARRAGPVGGPPHSRYAAPTAERRAHTGRCLCLPAQAFLPHSVFRMHQPASPPSLQEKI